MLRTLTVSAALTAAALTLAGCQSPTAASTTTNCGNNGSTCVITFTMSPSPTSAFDATSQGVTYVLTHNNAPDTNQVFPWETQFTLNMKNTQATGVKITAVTVRVQQASSGIVITPTTSDVEHYTFNSQPANGSSRIEGNSTNALNFSVWYVLPNLGKEALITVSLSFQDDNNVSLSGVETDNVAP